MRTDPYSYLSGGQPWINHEWLSGLMMALASGSIGGAGAGRPEACRDLGDGWCHPVPPPPPSPAAGGRRHRHHHGLVARPAMDNGIPAADLHLPGKRHRAQPRRARRRWRLRRTLVGCASICDLGEPPRRVHRRHRPVRDLGSRSCGQPRVVVRVATPGRPVCGESSRSSPAGGDSRHRDYAFYGPTLWAFLRTALEPRAEIAEWNPIAVTSLEGVAHLVILLPALVGWLGSERARPPGLVAVCVCAAAGPFVARRHTPLFAVAVMMLASEHMADVRLAGSSPAGSPVAPPPRRRRGFARRLRRRWHSAPLFSPWRRSPTSAPSSSGRGNCRFPR